MLLTVIEAVEVESYYIKSLHPFTLVTRPPDVELIKLFMLMGNATTWFK